MAERRRAAIALALVAAAAAVVLTVSSGGPSHPGTVAAFQAEHGTRPTPLDSESVTRVARAFGITEQPRTTEDGWEAEDTRRSLYLMRTPSAWYAAYTDSSMLLHPLGDHDSICARLTAPPGCRYENVDFVTDVGAEAPTVHEALRAARRVLDEAGVSDARWRAVVLRATPDVIPCREELRTPVDCTQQYVPTRAVMLALDLGPGKTDLRWGVVVGPGGQLLSATGRIAEPAAS